MPTAVAALHNGCFVLPPVISYEILAGMKALRPAAAELLQHDDFDVMGYGCTLDATVIGPSGVAAEINRLHPSAKVINKMSAVVTACWLKGYKRCGFVIPDVP